MSSIIDALKKSDQNRNNENNSDVNHINFSEATSQKSRRGFWLLVAVLLLIALAVFAWQQGWHSTIINRFQASPEPNGQPLVANEVQANKQAKNTSDQKAKVNQLVPPKQSEIKAKSKQLTQAATQPVTDSENSTAAIIPIKQNTVLTERKTKENEVDTLLPVNKGPTIKPITTADESETKVAIHSDKEGSRDQSLEPSLKQDYLLIHQIEYAIRKDIPNIKINIHIYDPEAENRMVLINGERFNIGDTIDDAVTIQDIVPEGIVVAFAGIEFLIPK
ncbi:general secretion pathway protein GspB [Marinicella litoralis]|uniref:Type II secretion system (T2SS) protein B n=1 Tax=Marinicella litoralis TaxID=644220 RepID=A0A4R6XQQ8_9GAMM|nr:general secretion pathway protein GspB [Marinicella litoralis]TDR20560.1 type II secretion system (T2SS) protein B [Marinicella litoralis]